MNRGGFFELTIPRHLLEKAEHDLERLRRNQLDTYAAFDLFVTARHVPEWLFPGDKSRQTALFKQYLELRICRQVADGAKHFAIDDPRHRQVLATDRERSAWGESWGSSWGTAWGASALTIRLDPADPDTAMIGSQISAIELGERVLSVLRLVVL